MDFAAKINELRASLAKLEDGAEEVAKSGDAAKINELSDKIEGIKNSIAAYERLAKNSSDGAGPAAGGSVAPPSSSPADEIKPFNSLGEQLRAIYMARKYGRVDDRLAKVNDAVTGASEAAGADGGFAVQTDFAAGILQSAVKAGQILSRVDTYTCGSNANSVRTYMIDETSIASTVYGGVEMHWAAEGGTVTASRPKMREMKLDLEKMMGFAYATEELLEDAPFMSSLFERAFAIASTRLLEAAIVNGDGAGKPLGILKSGALVTVAKEAQQAADTIVAGNIIKMWPRADYYDRSRFVWLAHPDAEEQLTQMVLGTTPIWMPEGGLVGLPYQTLRGRPIIYTDECSALGDVGDIILCDLSQYLLVKKGNVRTDWSMHVEFLTDQMCFRVVFRCNGAPKVNAPLTIKNSNNTRSPFVAVAARA
jgi:HK97 family phage major capsid protein